MVFSANAADAPSYIIKEETLSFGKIAVVSRAVTSSLSIDIDGKITTTKGIYILEVGHPAELIMVNYTPYTQYSISVFIADPETTTGAISSNQFTLTSVTAPLTITTDSEGEASFSVGGTIETSGDTSKTYYDTDYQARYMLTITY